MKKKNACDFYSISRYEVSRSSGEYDVISDEKDFYAT